MIQTVSVIGSGTMGSGIAQVSALAGYDVILYDLTEDLLTSAMERITQSIDKDVLRGKTASDDAAHAKQPLKSSTSLIEAATADLIIEAIPEKLNLKRELFATLEAHASEHALFASNTSSLSINVLAAATNRQDRFVGLHFFNPAHIMKLVEVIRGDFTSDVTVAATEAYVEKLGKTAVSCKDTPAFIVNRVARPFYGEALRLLGENAADAETIDKLMKSIGFRMGPFELIDLIGSDVNFAVTQSVYDAYFQEPKYRPHPIQRRMVESGRLGRKTEHGFYDYREK